ncbi:MAG: hypothetical protein F6K39_41575, partial [Okeania sp. SIO3B3]|nr:hypothetical protein [Okeania sp. SIO3B3]
MGIISCSVEYLHFGGRKAAGAGGSYAEGKKRLKGIKFFITDPSEHDITPSGKSS